MPSSTIKLDELEGDQLRRWYLRTPAEIEEERSARRRQQADEFYGLTQAEAGEAAAREPSYTAPSSDVLYIATGAGGYRAIRRDAVGLIDPGGDRYAVGRLPSLSAAFEDADFLEIGSRENRELKKLHVAENGPWPTTDSGLDYHVSHKRAIADGGSNSLDNIEPAHPAEHAAQHLNNGDYARWGRRPSIARAFGGTVERLTGGPVVRGLGPLTLASNALGLLSGRIKATSYEDLVMGLLGLPPMSEYRKGWRARGLPSTVEDPNWRWPDCPKGMQCA